MTGLSLTFAVNVLAPYLLTALVERPDRLVYMTSGLQNGAGPDLDDAQWTRRRWDWLQAYSESKLHVTTLAFGVARRWPEVRSNAVSPGWVADEDGRRGAPDDLALGAETQAWLAAGEDPATDVTAEYLYHRQPADVPAAVPRRPRAGSAVRVLRRAERAAPRVGPPRPGQALRGVDLRHDLLGEALEVVDGLGRGHVAERRPQERHRHARPPCTA
jgi:NAD(P)-dependent dehydrogenase (short-subunit alcohol dehydrogenase family)